MALRDLACELRVIIELQHSTGLRLASNCPILWYNAVVIASLVLVTFR